MMSKSIGSALALGAFILALAASLRIVEGLGIVEADTAKRTMQVVIGLILAAYGNLMPKALGRWPASPRAAARAQSALRVGGWSMTLAGLAHAAFWAWAPMGVADVGSLLAVAAATVLTMSYGGWTVLSCRRAAAP